MEDLLQAGFEIPEHEHITSSQIRGGILNDDFFQGLVDKYGEDLIFRSAHPKEYELKGGTFESASVYIDPESTTNRFARYYQACQQVFDSANPSSNIKLSRQLKFGDIQDYNPQNIELLVMPYVFGNKVVVGMKNSESGTVIEFTWKSIVKDFFSGKRSPVKCSARFDEEGEVIDFGDSRKIIEENEDFRIDELTDSFQEAAQKYSLLCKARNCPQEVELVFDINGKFKAVQTKDIRRKNYPRLEENESSLSFDSVVETSQYSDNIHGLNCQFFGENKENDTRTLPLIVINESDWLKEWERTIGS